MRRHRRRIHRLRPPCRTSGRSPARRHRRPPRRPSPTRPTASAAASDEPLSAKACATTWKCRYRSKVYPRNPEYHALVPIHEINLRVTTSTQGPDRLLDQAGFAKVALDARMQGVPPGQRLESILRSTFVDLAAEHVAHALGLVQRRRQIVARCFVEIWPRQHIAPRSDGQQRVGLAGIACGRDGDAPHERVLVDDARDLIVIRRDEARPAGIVRYLDESRPA